MNTFDTWSEAITSSFQNLWVNFIEFLPTVLGAILILALGLILASALGNLITRVIKLLRIDAILEKTKLPKRLEESGVNFRLSSLLGWVFKWFLIIVTLIAVADFLQWNQITDFLSSVALYVPNVLVAVVILTIGFIVGRYVHEVIKRGVNASRLPNSSVNIIATVAEWSIIIFAALAALTQLGIASRLIEIFFTGLVAAVALAFGLSFGLGGRDKAREWLERIDNKFSSK